MSAEWERTGAPQPGETVDLLPGEYLEHGVPSMLPARFTVEAVGMAYVQNGRRFVDAKGRLLRADGGTEPVPRYLSIILGPA
jgi:hypothetical protein